MTCDPQPAKHRLLRIWASRCVAIATQGGELDVSGDKPEHAQPADNALPEMMRLPQSENSPESQSLCGNSRREPVISRGRVRASGSAARDVEARRMSNSNRSVRRADVRPALTGQFAGNRQYCLSGSFTL